MQIKSCDSCFNPNKFRFAPCYIRSAKAIRQSLNVRCYSWVATSILIFACILPLLAGCGSIRAKQAQPAGREVPVNSAIVETDSAIVKADQKRDEQIAAATKIAGIIKAEVEDAKDANLNGSPEAAKAIVERDLAVVTNCLKDVPADPVHQSLVKQHRLQLASGNTSAALDVFNMAMTNASSNANKLGQIKQEADQLKLQRDLAREKEKAVTHEYINDAIDAQVSNQAEFNKLKQQLTDQIRNKQVLFLSIGGIVLLALFGVGIGFGGVAGAKIAWPLGVIGLLFLGLAQVVSQPWFMWACLVVTLAGLGLLAWWIWSHYQLGNLKDSLQVKSNQLQGALGDVIPVLDNAYDSVNQDTKDILDKIIFDKLAVKMNNSTKGVIHQVRADIAKVPSNLPPE